MSRNTNFSENESSWAGLFSEKGLLGVGLILLLVNIAAFVGIDVKTLLFDFNLRFWSIYMSIALWTIVIWLVAESMDFLEDYLSYIRIIAAMGVLSALILALQSSAGSGTAGYPLWLMTAIAAAACCAVRSAFLLHNYWNDGGESIDEEVQWFLGMSGYMLSALALLGIMYIIPVKTQLYADTDSFVSVPFLKYCWSELEVMIRFGHGSFAIRIFGFLIFAASVTFVYIAGKWMLLFLYKIRGD
jgi:hypothetical protein